MKVSVPKLHPDTLKELGNQFAQYSRLMRLDRPIGIWLLLWPALWALWISAQGSPDPWVFAVFVLGVIVTRSAGCVINDYADREIDRQVLRTRDRPLASGELDPTEALVLFAALATIAIGLVLTLNRQSQLIAILAGVLMVVYPFSKRFFVAPQLLLGAAFACSVPMAFAAQTGTIPRLAWLMWLAVVIWTVIYDTMYAMADREEDLQIGVKSTAILFGQADLYIVGILQFILLLALFLIGEVATLGPWYRLGVLVAGLFMVYQHGLIRSREPGKCFRAFVNNRHIGAAVFAGIVLAYTFNPPLAG